MNQDHTDMQALAKAFELFTETTRTMEESYRLLEVRVKDLDNEVAAKNRDLALANDYLNSILESMSDGVVAIDTEGVITRFNRSATDILGHPADDAVGKLFQDLFGRAFRAPDGRGLRELRAKDGTMIPVSERDAPISDRSGRHIGTVKVFQDLSEVEMLREQVRHKDRLAAVGEMAATVAHEIRNPLGGIRGFAALLLRDLSEEDHRRRLVEKILAGAKDLDEVVTELLEYTRPLQLRQKETTWPPLINAALSFLEFNGKSISLEQSVAPSAPVLADFDRIRQVLLNILINAVQSIEDTGQIRIVSSTEQGASVLMIEDTGCGMTPEQLKQAFSPFYTTKEKGTGLGLAVAAKIVEGHGGLLIAESTAGVGSRFTITLPG